MGIKAIHGCGCKACEQLREVPLSRRIGQGFGVLVALVMAIGGLGLVALLLVWACVAVVGQL